MASISMKSGVTIESLTPRVRPEAVLVDVHSGGVMPCPPNGTPIPMTTVEYFPAIKASRDPKRSW